MIISEDIQSAIDLNWFGTDLDGFVVHVASGGGKLPDSIASDKENVEKVASFFRQKEPISNSIIVNEKLKDLLAFSNDQDEKQYLRDFVDMAKRGLFSFDKTILNNFSDPNYHLVAYPHPEFSIRLDDLPQDLAAIIAKTKFNLSIINCDHFSVVDAILD